MDQYLFPELSNSLVISCPIRHTSLINIFLSIIITQELVYINHLLNDVCIYTQVYSRE